MSILEDYNKEISEIYKKENLISVYAANDGNNLPNGRPVFGTYYQITRHRNCAFPNNIVNYDYIMDDLVLISHELMYFTASLYLYQPLISTPLRNFNGDFYALVEDIPTRRYITYIDSCLEKVYNFYERIGNLLKSYFPSEIEQWISFGRVIRYLITKYPNNVNLNHLYNLYLHDYKPISEQRRDNIHYTTWYTEKKWEHLKNITDSVQAESFSNELMGYPDIFKTQLHNQRLALEYTIEFLEDMNDELNYKCPEH